MPGHAAPQHPTTGPFRRRAFFRRTTVKISVTQEDIAKGERCKARNCPIARAIQRVLPGHSVLVSQDLIETHCTATDEINLYDIPEKAQVFVQVYDDFDHVEPFEFELGEPLKAYFAPATESIKP
jgi:hypothetical protein